MVLPFKGLEELEDRLIKLAYFEWKSSKYKEKRKEAKKSWQTDNYGLAQLKLFLV